MAAEPFVSLVLETIRDLLLEEAKFLYGVGDQVREIQEQLQMMKSFLRDADQRQRNDELVRTWVQQVRRLANRTEDVLETYALEVVSKKGNGRMKDVLKRFSCILSEGKSLHKVGTEIVNINSRIANLKADRETYGINDLNEGENAKEAKARQRLLRQTYAHEVEEHFVGMKDDIRELVSLITDNERDCRVVSIWGMGGLGKTTLAKKIFNHGTVRSSFKTFAWVCITEQCQIVEALQDILSQLGVDMQEKRVPALVIKLHQVLEENNCLVVLDDIWKMEDLKVLRPAFPIKNVSSRILLTTRSEDVAKKGVLYKLKTFTEEEGWELLRKKTINRPKEKDHETELTFEAIGREIVRKCGFLPLAISVIGGILREKSFLREWEAVNENINSYLRRGETSKSVSNVLSLSYDELPYYLKPCFLYMGSFREDEIIKVEKLYLLWIAEGLVLSEHCGKEESMMDVAERYLNELSSRSMVEVRMDVISIVPKLRSSQLHDLMRDLCLDKGRKEHFLEVILLRDLDSVKENENESLADASSLLDRVRRLGFHIHHDIDFDTMMAHPGRMTDDVYRSFVEVTYPKLLAQVKGKYLRTLLVRGNGLIHLPDISDLKKFNLLRVLEFYNCRFEFAKEINQLIHLRYLSTEGSFVTKLPSSISDFLYLQTLNLRTIDNIYLPNIFGKMKRLKHINLPREFEGSEKLQFKDLRELETLHGFQMSGNETADLSGLVNLRSFSGRLEIHALSQIIDQIYSWKKIKAIKFEMFGDDLKREESLVPLRKVLMCEKINCLDITSHMVNFPPYEPQFLPNLTRMRLDNTKFEEDPMQFLQKLPNLRDLGIYSKVFMGKEMVCDAVGFPQLKSLKLDGLPNLEIWRVDEGAMPKLSDLVIKDCKSLETITDGLNFSALEIFGIRSLHKEFKEKYGTLYDQERKKLYG